MEAKKHIRKEVFARRRETPEQDIRNGSRRIFSQVVQLPEYRKLLSFMPTWIITGR